jgi:hypothetical protein
LLVQIVPVHGVTIAVLELGGGATAVGDVTVLEVVGLERAEVEDDVNGSNGLVVLAVLKLASLSLDKDESTLSTELVAVNVPGGIVGVVPAKLIVGEVVRPKAPLSAVLTALEVLMAGVTEDSGLVVVGKAPDDA